MCWRRKKRKKRKKEQSKEDRETKKRPAWRRCGPTVTHHLYRSIYYPHPSVTGRGDALAKCAGGSECARVALPEDGSAQV